jgi:glycosyltransferase involved in cell wall biosynthesis
MNILHVVTAFSPAVVYGGPSVVAAQQANSLAGRGHQVTVATSNIFELRPVRYIEDHKKELSGTEVVYFPSRVLRPRFPFIISTELSGWLRRYVENFDVVHVHFAREWIPVRAAQIAIGGGVPTFLQPHGMLGRTDGVRSLIDRLWAKRLLESAAGVFSLQQHENNEIKRIAPKARVLELPNGITLPAHAEAWTADNPANPMVLFLGRLHPRKRVLAFVEMARVLRDRGVSARYRIVGPDDGDLSAAQQLVREYSLQDRVVFVGSSRREAVTREYLDSSVYVLPAVNEPFPIAVLEALSLGVPTIVTNRCFIAPMLEENEAALVSSPEPEMLADSVRRILCEPALAENLSTAGRRLIQEELTVDHVAERLEKYYGGARA